MSKESSPPLSSIWKASSNSLVFQAAYFVANRYFAAGQTLDCLEQLQHQLPDIGLHQVAKQFLAALGFALTPDSTVPSEIKQPNRPVLLVSTDHGAFIEPFIIAAALDRPDIFFIGIKTYQKLLGNNIAPHILPVMPSRYATNHRQGLTVKLSNTLNPIKPLYLAERLTTEQITTLNQTSLTHAANLLTAGSVVAIFPNGGRKSSYPHWGSGLANIVSTIPQTQYPNIQVAFIYLQGPTKRAVALASRNSHRRRHQSDPKPIPITCRTFTLSDLINNAQSDCYADLTATLQFLLSQEKVS